MRYPQSRYTDTAEELNGYLIADPYRWLEDSTSAETQAWIREQNALTHSYLDSLPERGWFANELTRMLGRPYSGRPYKKGGRYFVSRNDGTQAQDSWCWAPTLQRLVEGGRTLVDPNRIDPSGSTHVAATAASEDGRYFAYALSGGGSDWLTIRVRDIDAKRELDDEVTHAKFCTPTWLPDGQSFVYLHFPTDRPATGTDCGRQPAGVLKVHRLGTDQAEDRVIFDSEGNCRTLALAEVSFDQRWLIVEIQEGTSTSNRLWAYPLSGIDRTEIGDPVKMLDRADARYESIRVVGDRMLIRTNLNAPLYRVVSAPIVANVPRLDVVIPEREELLESATSAGGSLLAVHLEDAMPVLHRFAVDGSTSATIPLSGAAVVALHGRSDDLELFVGMTTATARLKNYRVDLDSFDTVKLSTSVRAGSGKRPLPWQPPVVTYHRASAVSADGTSVPYSVLRREDVPLDRPRPTMLCGYGGFNVPMLAEFRPGWPAWLEAGGVLVLANLRGGGEFGSAWHEAGRLAYKQRVFDDFISIAEQLIDDKITTSAQLALHGRSNGGLLVGAVMTQRPDLAAAALPMVGVLDMMRFAKFTVGESWISDYGSPEDPAMTGPLLAYSPLHNVRDGESYPATLVFTGDHDDRVVPAHSYKFTAALQHAQAGAQPILARIETRTGHGAGKPRGALADEWADLLAFAAHHTGLRPS